MIESNFEKRRKLADLIGQKIKANSRRIGGRKQRKQGKVSYIDNETGRIDDTKSRILKRKPLRWSRRQI